MPRQMGPPRYCERAQCRRELTPKQRKKYGKRGRFCSVSCATLTQHAENRLGGGKLKRLRCRCGCRKRFKQTRTNQKYASPSCASKASAVPKKDRAARRATHAERHPSTIFITQLRKQLDAEGFAGRCLFCPVLLSGAKKTICARGGTCEREYMKLWNRGRRYAAKCKAEGRPVTVDDEPTPEEQEAVRDISEARMRLSCELDAFRAKVAALALDYGLAA